IGDEHLRGRRPERAVEVRLESAYAEEAAPEASLQAQPGQRLPASQRPEERDPRRQTVPAIELLVAPEEPGELLVAGAGQAEPHVVHRGHAFARSFCERDPDRLVDLRLRRRRGLALDQVGRLVAQGAVRLRRAGLAAYRFAR